MFASTIQTFLCADCSQTKPVQTNGGVGYGIYLPDTSPVCYECCGKRDRAAMVADGKAILYLVRGHVGNWPGTLNFPLIRYRIGKHNMSGKRYDVDFMGPDGYVWHGVTYGDNTQICHCHRTKAKA